MSDIYLSLTETPSVVTLSQPVISGALASTVTVANTVTVALDANSLSALENVTVTVGAAVSISNFPASQVVTGSVAVTTMPALNISSVSISNFPSTQTVAGTVTVGNSVTIGNFPAVQDVAINGNPAVYLIDDEQNPLGFGQNPVLVSVNGTASVAIKDPSNLSITSTTAAGSKRGIDANLISSVTIASLPSISGTVTANVPLSADGFTTVQGVRIVGAGVNNVVRIEGVGTAYQAADMREGGGIIALGKTGGNPGSANDELRPVPLKSDGMSVMISGTVTVGNSVTIGSLPAISGTVTANLNNTNLNTVTIGVRGTVTASGLVNATGADNSTIVPGFPIVYNDAIAEQPEFRQISYAYPLPVRAYFTTVTVGNSVTIGSLPAISGTVTIGSALPDGTNRIGVVTIGGGSVTLGASTAQIGSVTASISGTVPVSISSVTVGNSITIGSCVTHGVTIANTSVTVNGTFFQATQPVSLASLPALAAGTAQIGSVTASIIGTVPVSGTFYQATQPVSLTTLPALVAGTAQIGSVTASISNSVVTFYPMQGTSVSNTNFTSTTASTTLVSAVANREVLTVFNEGAGNLHISPGATCTTVAYQVRLSAGDYWECPQGQLSLAHTAVFATAGTARVTQVS